MIAKTFPYSGRRTFIIQIHYYHDVTCHVNWSFIHILVSHYDRYTLDILAVRSLINDTIIKIQQLKVSVYSIIFILIWDKRYKNYLNSSKSLRRKIQTWAKDIALTNLTKLMSCTRSKEHKTRSGQGTAEFQDKYEISIFVHHS